MCVWVKPLTASDKQGYRMVKPIVILRVKVVGAHFQLG